MGTRSTIAKEYADGTVKQIYCHWDGYLAHNGMILYNHYSDPTKVNQLIKMGDVSVLKRDIGIKRPFDCPAGADYKEFHKQYENQCVFYGRDGGQPKANVKAFIFKNFDHYIENSSKMQEYNYIMRNGVWYVDNTEFDDDSDTGSREFYELGPCLTRVKLCT